MKFFTRVFCVVVTMGIIGLMQTSEHIYYREGTVIEVRNNIIAVEDDNGNIWEYYNSAPIVESVGDRVKLKMHDNMTDNIIKDDRVISVKKI